MTHYLGYVKKALEEPTLEEALAFIVQWDTDRAVQQALRNTASNFRNADGSLYDTCNLFLIRKTMAAWRDREGSWS